MLTRGGLSSRSPPHVRSAKYYETWFLRLRFEHGVTLVSAEQ